MRLLLLIPALFIGVQSFAQLNEVPQTEPTTTPQANVEQISTKSELKVKRIERPRMNAQERKEPVVKPIEEKENNK